MASRLKSAIKFVVWSIFNKYRIKDSFFYWIYLSIFFPSHTNAVRLEREFFATLILEAGGGTVFDIGANGGDKTAIFVRYAKRVVSVEPSPGAIDVLRQRYKHNRRVVIVPKGVGACEGSASLHVFGPADGLNTFSDAWAGTHQRGDGRYQRPVVETVEATITTLDRLVAEFGAPCYVKIDVEGYEIQVVLGLSQSVPLLSFECNLPQFMEESARIVAILNTRAPQCTFNYCVTEPPAKLELQTWVGASAITDMIKRGGYPFMEIYCRSDAS